MINKYNVEYKDIEGYEGLYAITVDGRVWSYRSNKFLSPADDGYGYKQVKLTKDGKQKACRVHRLVGQAFIPNPENKPQINHKDAVRDNNHVDNLEWVTAQENIDAKADDRRRWKPVYCIENDTVYKNQGEAAEALGVTHQTISKAVNGQIKTVKGLHLRHATIDDTANSISKKLDYMINMVELDRMAMGREAALNAQYRAIEKKIAEAI
jgi:plasmid maintenance system antidote protein VapI